MNLITKIECFIVGWKPEILKECREISYAMLKKYTAAIIILSIIWGVIGWNFAGNYLGIESWYGKVITSMVFIAIIVCVERYIILSYGNLKTIKIFRFCLAFLMAVLGSTIFDQIIFRNDIQTEQIKQEVNNQGILLQNSRNRIDSMIALTKNQNTILREELQKNPQVPGRIEGMTKEVIIGQDDFGKPILGKTITSKTELVDNPRWQDKEKSDLLIKEYQDSIYSLDRQQIHLAETVTAKIKNKEHNIGFLQELGILVQLLKKNIIMLVFWCILFAFLMCLEMLVLTTKGKDNCDYEILLDFQLKQRKKELDTLDNQPPPDSQRATS